MICCLEDSFKVYTYLMQRDVPAQIAACSEAVTQTLRTSQGVVCPNCLILRVQVMEGLTSEGTSTRVHWSCTRVHSSALELQQCKEPFSQAETGCGVMDKRISQV